jgi:NADH-quinone oxidoreductase subunit N
LGVPYAIPGGNIPFYLVGYALASLAAFSALATVGSDGEEMTTESQLAGLGWRYPFAGGVLALSMLSLAGVPPTVGFFGKFVMVQEVMAVEDSRYLPHIIVMIVNSVVSAYYYLRVTVYVYMKPATDDQKEPIRDVSLKWAMAISGMALLLIGALPGRFVDMGAKAAASIRTPTVTAHIRHALKTGSQSNTARPGKHPSQQVAQHGD